MARPLRGTAAAALLATALAACSTAAPAQSGPEQVPPATRPAPTSAAELSGPAHPCGITYSDGYLYYSIVAGQPYRLPRSIILRVSLATGQAAEVAGATRGGLTGNGSLATRAFIGPSCGLVVDHAGNLLLSDGAMAGYKSGDVGRNRVRAVAAADGSFYGQSMQAGHIYTIAGRWNEGSTGDGGPATAALLSFPSGLAVDPAGDVLIAVSDPAVRILAARSGTFYGVAMRAGNIYTVAGGHLGSFGNGVPARRAGLGAYPFADGGHMTADYSIFADARGNILIADSGNGEIRVVAGSDGSFYGLAMRTGYIYTVVGGGPKRSEAENVGHPAVHAGLDDVGQVAVDHAGNIIFGHPGAIDIVPATSGRGTASTCGPATCTTWPAARGTAPWSRPAGPPSARSGSPSTRPATSPSPTPPMARPPSGSSRPRPAATTARPCGPATSTPSPPCPDPGPA